VHFAVAPVVTIDPTLRGFAPRDLTGLECQTAGPVR
jgi:hypothetical protein